MSGLHAYGDEYCKKDTEVNLDFDSITGNDLAEVETEVRMMGDKTPSVLLSMKYQVVLQPS